MKDGTFLMDRVALLERQLDSKIAELEDVTNMGVMLTSMIEVDAILSAMMEMSLRMVSAEVGCILLKKDDHLETHTSWGIDESLVRSITVESDIDISQSVCRTGEAVIINDLPENPDVAGFIDSVMCVPIRYKSDPVGVLVAINRTDRQGFIEDDKRSLERLANFAAVAVENARLMRQQLEKQRLEHELSLAEGVQKALLPTMDLKPEGFAIESLYLPAGQVGGDYYDFIPLSDHEFVVIVGDVSSKGVPAALMMTAVRSAIRAVVTGDKEVAELVGHINDVLCQDVLRNPGLFISLILARFDARSGRVIYTNAGHLPPQLLNVHTGRYMELRTGGVILGQFDGFKYKSEEITLQPGDRILMYTDGVTECVDSNGEMFGRERLQRFFQSMRRNQLNEILECLRTEIGDFTLGAGETQFDDLTAVVVEYEQDNHV
jgi:sigma-B regulation protein RsbU (phosphoserine phosphatase)